MKLCTLILSTLLLTNVLFAEEILPLYSLPKISENRTTSNSGSGKNKNSKNQSNEAENILATDSGLYRVHNGKTLVPLWTEGKVKQILPVETVSEEGKSVTGYYFTTSKGILYSENLKDFELRNTGLPFLVVKKYEDSKTTFENQAQDLKDISVNPLNPLELVTATKDRVYLTRDGGMNWQSIGSASYKTNGIKAVAIASMRKTSDSEETETVVFLAHSILGFYYYKPDAKKPDWIEASAGLKNSDPSNSSDEVADILPVLFKDESGKLHVEIFLSQTFIPRIYHFDMDSVRSTCIYKTGEPLDTIDGLCASNSSIIFLTPGSLQSYDMVSGEVKPVDENISKFRTDMLLSPSVVNAGLVCAAKNTFETDVVLNELWLLDSGRLLSPYASKIDGRKSLYVPAYQAHLPGGKEKFHKIIKDNNLNSLVIDMKDDYGLLRYDAQDPLVTQKGVVSKYALDLDAFVKEFKDDGIYLIARIVVFKDRNLANYNNSVYAVWDAKTKRPWVGIKGYETQEDGTKTAEYYDEAWVDPFCPEVWEYDVAIAKELISRGFDEIQFDYIRFPTDGYNLSNADFRWKSDGMDKESALVSFLNYARRNIDAPIGIDIYGANGWYRSGTRTGQDVETLSNYVDVICPMFYPSHFENKFLNYEPYEERPYRIYYYGTYRNSVIARNRSLVRPWVQTFFLNVPYDRTYYDTEYVRKEMFGVRDSVNRGYMHWNNAGNYAKISPDPGAEKYTGKSFEADEKFRKPALGKHEDPLSFAPSVFDSEEAKRNISILDYVKNQDENYESLFSPEEYIFGGIGFKVSRDIWLKAAGGNL